MVPHGRCVYPGFVCPIQHSVTTAVRGCGRSCPHYASLNAAKRPYGCTGEQTGCKDQLRQLFSISKHSKCPMTRTLAPLLLSGRFLQLLAVAIGGARCRSRSVHCILSLTLLTSDQHHCTRQSSLLTRLRSIACIHARYISQKSALDIVKQDR